jgi:3-methyladenine DNA glycosylase AlkC
MATLLKNLYSQEFIEKLSNSLQNSCKDFKVDEFKKAIFTNAWEDFELKQRMRHISKTLESFYHFHIKSKLIF